MQPPAHNERRTLVNEYTKNYLVIKLISHWMNKQNYELWKDNRQKFKSILFRVVIGWIESMAPFFFKNAIEKAVLSSMENPINT